MAQKHFYTKEYITKDQLIKNWAKIRKKENGLSVSICEIVDSIKNQDVEPVRHARWIKKGQAYEVLVSINKDLKDYKCSLCGRVICSTKEGLDRFPYCHCGAKMDLKEEE